MKALVHAEVLKLRSTRTVAWLMVATLAMVALTVAVSVPKAATSPTAVGIGSSAAGRAA